jgi:hypothetical protein
MPEPGAYPDLDSNPTGNVYVLNFLTLLHFRAKYTQTSNIAVALRLARFGTESRLSVLKHGSYEIAAR